MNNIDSDRISVNTSSLIDIEDNIYSRTVSVELSIIDSTEKTFLKAFPGLFKGVDTNDETVQFISYGLINISIEDNKSNTLNLSKDDTATLVFKVPSSEKAQTIPLWYYDHLQGLWIEEGYAELQEDGSYKGEVSHLGTWSLNQPITQDPGILRGRIIDIDGLPMSNIRIHAIGENWISSVLSTDADGNFELEVVPDSNFQLTAYNYEEKYSAIYAEEITGIASGEIIE